MPLKPVSCEVGHRDLYSSGIFVQYRSILLTLHAKIIKKKMQSFVALEVGDPGLGSLVTVFFFCISMKQGEIKPP